MSYVKFFPLDISLRQYYGEKIENILGMSLSSEITFKGKSVVYLFLFWRELSEPLRSSEHIVSFCNKYLLFQL